MKNKHHLFEIGIDEAGRGPLAGPVAVGVVLVPINFDWNLISGVNDSKQLSAEKRKALFRRAKELQKQNKLQYAVSMVSASIIDQRGIVSAVNLAMSRALKKILSSSAIPREPLEIGTRQGLVPAVSSTRPCLVLDKVIVKLDGSLYAPAKFIHQETIVKGDAKEKVIGLASIMAKVTRDRYMEKLAKKPQFRAYDFARHKGYGTEIHRIAIAKNGLSTEHRVNYCGRIKVVV